jgi:hypothetical protein
MANGAKDNQRRLPPFFQAPMGIFFCKTLFPDPGCKWSATLLLIWLCAVKQWRLFRQRLSGALWRDAWNVCRYQ